MLKNRLVQRVSGAAALTHLCLCAGGAHADIVEHHAGPGLNLVIPDNTYESETFGFEGMGSHSIMVDEAVNGVILDVNITIGMSHFWIGDLTIKLRGPGGTTLTLLNRPGHPDTFFGSSSDFAFEFPIGYDDEATGGWSAEDMGGTGGGCGTVGSGSGACGSVFVPAPEGLEGTSLSDFDGHLINGEWTLYIGDSAGSQAFATLDQWILTFDVEFVPGPGAVVVLAMGLMGVHIRTLRR